MRDEVVGLSREVLENKLDPSSGVWVFVWRNLHQHDHQGEIESEKSARRWLTRHPDHSGWPMVIKNLYNSGLDDESLEKQTFDWLGERIGIHPHWRVTWNALAKRPRNMERLHKIGLDYLASHPVDAPPLLSLIHI